MRYFLSSVFLLWLLGISAQKNLYVTEIAPTNRSFLDKPYELSSLDLVGDSLYILSESCKKYFVFNTVNMSVTEFTMNLDGHDNIDLEGIAVYRNFLFLSNEEDKSIIIYDTGARKEVPVSIDGFSFPDNDAGGEKGLEGIEISADGRQLYVLQERANESGSAKLYYFNINWTEGQPSIVIPQDTSRRETYLKFSKGKRMADLALSPDENTLYLLRTQKGNYFVDSLPLSGGRPPGDTVVVGKRNDRYRELKARRTSGKSTNIEGIAAAGTSDFFLISDSHQGDGCGVGKEINDAKPALFLRTTTVDREQGSGNNASGCRCWWNKITNHTKRCRKQTVVDCFPLVEFDFENPSYIKLPKKLRRGDFYQIRVHNVNRNNYAVVMDAQDTLYANNIDFSTFSGFDLGTLTGLVASLTANVSKSSEPSEKVDNTLWGIRGDKGEYIVASSDSVIDLQRQLQNEDMESLYSSSDSTIVSTSDLIEKINSATVFNFPQASKLGENEKTSLLDSLSQVNSSIIVRMLYADSQYRETFLNISERLSAVKAEADDYLTRLRSIQQTIDQRLTDIMTYRTLVYTDGRPEDYSPQDVEEDISRFNGLRNTLADLQEDIDSSQSAFQRFIQDSTVAKAIKENKDLQTATGNATATLKEAVTTVGKAGSSISPKTISNTLIHLYSLDTDYTFTSLPIQLNGSEAKLNMKFIPKDTANNFPPKVLPEIQFPFRPTYWSVGTGLYFSEFENERVGFEAFDTLNSTDTIRVFKEDPLEELGVALLLHAGAKLWQSSFGVHATVGTGLSLGETVRPRALLGFGITLGREHNLTLDVGVIAGYAQMISPRFADEFPLTVSREPQVFINDFRVKCFYSIGYAYHF